MSLRFPESSSSLSRWKEDDHPFPLLLGHRYYSLQPSMSPIPWMGHPRRVKDESVELLDQKPQPDAGSRATDLPPRILTPSTKTNRIAFWVEWLIILIIATISGLAIGFGSFKAATNFVGGKSAASCDLTYSHEGAFQSAFNINIRGKAHLSFTKAKAIDVFWQLIVGSGGRFMLAWISYKAFMDGLVRLTEQTPISYHIHTRLKFSTTSLHAILCALRGVYSCRKWRSRLIFFWFILSTLYVLGFPTLISATAGYISPSIAGYDRTMVVFSVLIRQI